MTEFIYLLLFHLLMNYRNASAGFNFIKFTGKWYNKLLLYGQQKHLYVKKYQSMKWCQINYCIRLNIAVNTVEPRYLELAYFELPLISKWKSDPCFNMQLWQQVTK